jgi:23S rRNA pseudouridine2605 synthase
MNKKKGGFDKFINKTTKKRKSFEPKADSTNKKFKKKNTKSTSPKPSGDGLIRLNKFLADAGICSRREADKLIESGAVTVNGKVVIQLGTKVSRTDKVIYGDQLLRAEKLQYIMLNKPKGYITTSDDPQDRKIVMTLVQNACKERIYPVGRLDRNTTGLLLFTNDGDLAKKLTHPKHGVKKLYHVVLDKPLTKNHLLEIAAGIKLEDGEIRPDKIAYDKNAADKREIGIELHSGRNRIVRRVFEHLGYRVEKLDRVMFASLTKKDIPRGKWRMLTEKEVNMLKMLP